MTDIGQRPRFGQRLRSASWRDLLVVGVPTILVAALAVGVAVKAARFAPPKTIYFTSGPDGSGYRNQAEKYQKILARDGVKVEILPSQGRARQPATSWRTRRPRSTSASCRAGWPKGATLPHLVSLGSVYPQPMMVYCRHPEPVELLTQLKGKRLAIGPEGSGTRVLALKLLKANEMDGPPTVLLELSGDEAAKQLLAGTIDAAFLMGDSATPAGDAQPARRARHPAGQLPPGRRLPAQVPVPVEADAARRARWTSAKDYPPRTLTLIGPTVELVARDDLHPALSDLLIRAAREIHGTPGHVPQRGRIPGAAGARLPDQRATPSATTSPASSSCTSGCRSGWPAWSTACWSWCCRCWS